MLLLGRRTVRVGEAVFWQSKPGWLLTSAHSSGNGVVGAVGVVGSVGLSGVCSDAVVETVGVIALLVVLEDEENGMSHVAMHSSESVSRRLSTSARLDAQAALHLASSPHCTLQAAAEEHGSDKKQPTATGMHAVQFGRKSSAVHCCPRQTVMVLKRAAASGEASRRQVVVHASP